MQNKDFFSGVPIEVREFLLRLLNTKKAIHRPYMGEKSVSRLFFFILEIFIFFYF